MGRNWLSVSDAGIIYPLGEKKSIYILASYQTPKTNYRFSKFWGRKPNNLKTRRKYSRIFNSSSLEVEETLTLEKKKINRFDEYVKMRTSACKKKLINNQLRKVWCGGDFLRLSRILPIFLNLYSTCHSPRSWCLPASAPILLWTRWQRRRRESGLAEMKGCHLTEK